MYRIGLGLVGLFVSMTVVAASGSDAVDFATEIGAIAGAAQVCGQNVTVLANRSTEAILLLSNTDDERNQAFQAYQKSMQTAIQAESASQRIACDKVLQDYNQLPLLRPDYKQSVLAQLVNNNKSSTVNNSAPAPAAPNNVVQQQPMQPQAINNGYVQPVLPSQQQQSYNSPMINQDVQGAVQGVYSNNQTGTSGANSAAATALSQVYQPNNAGYQTALPSQ